MVIANSTNKYSIAKFVVNPILGAGTHQTISAAVASASSGDDIFITVGTYTENVTLKAGINLTAFVGDGGDSTTSQVNIVGTVSASYSGRSYLNNITIAPSSASILSVTGSNNTVVIMQNCSFLMNGAQGFVFSSSGSGSYIYMTNCRGVCTSGFAFFNHSSAGTIQINYSLFDGPSDTASILSGSGRFLLEYSTTTYPFSHSGTSDISMGYSAVDIQTNETACTLSSTGTFNVTSTSIFSGTASCIDCGSGSTVNLTDALLTTTNVASITGSGTVNLGNAHVPNSGTISPTVTSDGPTYFPSISFNQGVDLLSTYKTGTFTPVLSGSISAGTGTYVTQNGQYTQIGNVVFFTWSTTISAHTGTGNIVLSGFPVAAKSAASTPIFTVYISGATTPVGSTSTPVSYVASGATTGGVYAYNPTTGTENPVLLFGAMALAFSGSYLV